MEEIDLITKQEFEDFLKMQERIEKLVEIKTCELAIIRYGKAPEGEICDFDIEQSDLKQGCIFVEFEIYLRGESCRDQYYLPFGFLYDVLYPAKYKMVLDKKKKRLEEQKEMMRQEDTEREKREYEEYERNEYERLKLKFGGE